MFLLTVMYLKCFCKPFLSFFSTRYVLSEATLSVLDEDFLHDGNLDLIRFSPASLYAVTVFGSHKIPPILYLEYVGSVTALKRLVLPCLMHLCAFSI